MEGVACIACHGAASDYRDRHSDSGGRQIAWRKLTPQEKDDKHGLINLRNPARRAEVCASCHVGNVKEGKVVTHEMYAAGHPPLPGIEMTEFSQAMPPHWWEPNDIERFKPKKHPELGPLYDYDPKEKHKTKSTVIGGAATLREAMILLVTTVEKKPAGKPRSSWPEFASLDCAACHHDLQAPGDLGWRQQRGAEGPFGPIVPGRPQARPWPFVLAELGLRHVERGARNRSLSAEYTSARRALLAATQARPFGDPPAVKEAAKALEAWSAKLIAALQSAPFDETVPRKLLIDLTASSGGEPPDFDTARQIAWAFRSIYSDWEPKPANDPEICAALCDLERQLGLDPDRLGDKLKDSLARAADYDPKTFLETIKALNGLLKEPAPVAARP